MASGWGLSDPQETINATIEDAVDWVRLELQIRETTESAVFCFDCDEKIPEKRRIFSKGCKYCVQCQENHDTIVRQSYNRSGSKDSQLR